MSRRLFLIQLMGPVHGSSIAGEAMKDYLLTPDDILVPINLADNSNEIGTFSVKKIIKLIFQIVTILKYSRKVDKYLLFYTSRGWLFYRDLLFRLILCNKEAILIMHNKGILMSRAPSIMKRLFFKNSHVIVLADELIKDFEQYRNGTRVSVIPNPLFESYKLSRKRNDYAQLKFLYLSNLIESKGVLESIELVKLLSDSGISVSLDIVGKEVDVSRVDIEKVIVNYKDIINYHGPKYGDEKVKFLEDANIFLFLSKYPMECSPLSIIEALAYSIPVVALNNGGIKSLVLDGYNGILINSLSCTRDVKELCTAILKFTRRDWQEMSKNAYAVYTKNHLLDQWRCKMEKIIK